MVEAMDAEMGRVLDVVIDPTTIADGDVLVGYPSAGFHANGWSLIRKILAKFPDEFSEAEIVDLLAPTRLYHDIVRGLREAGVKARSMAHITGGGLPENLGRVLGDKGAALSVPRWELGAVQKVLAHVEEGEANWTFNMGVGWVAIVAPEDADTALGLDGAMRLGEVGGTELTVSIG